MRRGFVFLVVFATQLLATQIVNANWSGLQDRERERIEREISRRPGRPLPPPSRPAPRPPQPILVKSFKVDKFITEREVIEVFDYVTLIRISNSDGKVEFESGTPYLINRYGEHISAPRIGRLSKGESVNWYPGDYNRRGRLDPEYVERIYLDMTSVNLTGGRGRVTVEIFR